MSAASIEARLRALEDVLRGGSTETGDGSGGGPASRLHALEAKLDALATIPSSDPTGTSSISGASDFQQLWQESDKLMMELDPGSALTHQQQIAAPLLYRRQQVLASADMMQQNMQKVHEILTLVSIGQAQIMNSDSATPISEMQVTKAPILTQTVPPSLQDQERLRKVEKNLLETQQQIESIAARMDRLVSAYHSLVAVVSEKMVLVDEAVASKAT